MSDWIPITETTETIAECLLWCSDVNPRGEAQGTVMGRITNYGDEVVARGSGMHGDWTFTHWMPLPGAP